MEKKNLCYSHLTSVVIVMISKNISILEKNISLNEIKSLSKKLKGGNIDAKNKRTRRNVEKTKRRI